MSTKASIERTIALAIQNAATDPCWITGPGRSDLTATPRAATRHCSRAWKRAYDEYMREHDGEPCNTVFARREGHAAFRNAMPVLGDRQSIRDFIACTAYGVQIGAINREQSGQLLYAAQVAITALPRERESGPKSTTPTPPPPQNAPLAHPIEALSCS